MTTEVPQFKTAPAPPPEPEEVAPKRKRRSDAGTKRVTRRGIASLETRLGGFIFQTNLVIRQIPAIRADALDAAEIQLLTKGIIDECRRHPTVRRYVTAMLDASSSGGLVLTVAIIVGRRAARHDVIPAGLLPIPNSAIDDTLGGLAQLATSTDPEAMAAIMAQMSAQPPASVPENGEQTV